jgi:hypothetical protein
LLGGERTRPQKHRDSDRNNYSGKQENEAMGRRTICSKPSYSDQENTGLDRTDGVQQRSADQEGRVEEGDPCVRTKAAEEANSH